MPNGYGIGQFVASQIKPGLWVVRAPSYMDYRGGQMVATCTTRAEAIRIRSHMAKTHWENRWSNA